MRRIDPLWWVAVSLLLGGMFAVGLSVIGYMQPLFAAVLMPLSSLATLAMVAIGLSQFRGIGV